MVFKKIQLYLYVVKSLIVIILHVLSYLNVNAKINVDVKYIVSVNRINVDRAKIYGRGSKLNTKVLNGYQNKSYKECVYSVSFVLFYSKWLLAGVLTL